MSYKSYITQFQRLADNQLNLPVGFYGGKMVNYDYIPYGYLGYAMVSMLWKGVEFHDNGTCTTILRAPAAWFINEEHGNVEIHNSVLDNKPCIKVSFADRFYEMREMQENVPRKSYSSIVRKINANLAWNQIEYDPLDIHILSSNF